MSLLPDIATLHERVQDCFVAYRGHGVSLSSVDLEILDDWAAAQVPFEVIARGLRRAAEALQWDAPEGEGHPRGLKSCSRQVRAEIAKYLRRSPGRSGEPATGEPFHVTRHKKLLAAIRKATKPSVPRWVDHLAMPSDFDGAERQEQLALGLLLRSLPFVKRTCLLHEARRLVEKGQSMSAVTKRESLRFHRAALVRQAWAMSTLW